MLWQIQASLPISDTTLVAILIFVFAALALLVLPAASFIRLVELIVSNGSKVEALMQEVLHLRTLLSAAMEPKTSLPPQEGTPTMPVSLSTLPTEPMPEIKSPSDSGE